MDFLIKLQKKNYLIFINAHNKSLIGNNDYGSVLIVTKTYKYTYAYIEFFVNVNCGAVCKLYIRSLSIFLSLNKFLKLITNRIY